MNQPISQFESDCRRAFNTLRRGPDWEVNDHVEVPALRHAALVMLVKNAEDVIGINLAHHYRLGFRRFFILDNNSTDKTTDIILTFKREHPDAGVFYSTDYITAYHQAAKTSAMAALAELYLSREQNPPDWIFPIDADEFITCCSRDGKGSAARLTAMLEDPGADVIVMNWAQSALHSRETGRTTQFSDRLSSTECCIWSHMAVYVSKVAYRTRRNLRPTEGNHFVTECHGGENALRKAIDAGFTMLHFPTRSLEQLRAKLVEGVQALDAAGHDHALGGHWRNYLGIYERAGEEGLNAIFREHINLCLV